MTRGAWEMLRRLGCKNLANFGESRQRMLGLTDVPIRTVIDVGANKGRRTREYRRKFPQATIYAVEPIPELYHGLERWAATQDRVHVLNLALGREAGRTEFFVHRAASIWSSLRIPETDNPRDYDPIRVDVDTLDGLAARLPLEDEILIKIDAEGCDLDVIDGGVSLLNRSAAVIIEALFFPSRYGERAPAFEDVVQRLWELGFAYRGNLSGAWHRGICHGVDAVFMRRDIARQLAA